MIPNSISQMILRPRNRRGPNKMFLMIQPPTLFDIILGQLVLQQTTNDVPILLKTSNSFLNLGRNRASLSLTITPTLNIPWTISTDANVTPLISTDYFGSG